MLKQTLSQKLQQKLSPQQIQLMKLVQLPTQSLEARIKQELEENPALNEGREKQEENFENDNGDEREVRDSMEEINWDDYLRDESGRDVFIGGNGDDTVSYWGHNCTAAGYWCMPQSSVYWHYACF